MPGRDRPDRRHAINRRNKQHKHDAMNKPHSAITAGAREGEETRGLYIDGMERRIEGRKTIVSPSTGKVIAQATEASDRRRCFS
jgi:hypothetical protein